MFTGKLVHRIFQRSMKATPRIARVTLTPTLLNSEMAESAEDITYADELSRHKKLLPLYDLYPAIDNNYIAESATIVGETIVDSYSTVWNNVVIRGDINSVYIGIYTSIGDNTVIQTVASLPTGLEASVKIGDNVTINSDCTLSS